MSGAFSSSASFRICCGHGSRESGNERRRNSFMSAGNGTNGRDHSGDAVGAEQSVLGSLLLGAPWAEVANVLKPAYFTRPDHALIFSAMDTLATSGQRIDVVTIAEHLQRGDRLDDAGGLGYLSQLVRETPTKDNIASYVRVVRERSFRRHLQELAGDPGMLAADLVAQIERDVAQFKALGSGATSPMNVLWYAALNGVVHQPQVVKGLIVAGSLFVIYGESNSGKTFLILDLALAIAAGKPWHGRRTKRGLVVYVAGEGAASVRSRVAAFRREHADVEAGIPFCIVPQPVDFLSAASVDTLIGTIRAAEVECREKAVLVVIDTFARAIPGGNENDAKDVGIAVAAADRLRAETGAAVGFIHHAGKDPTKGARGSSALRAATDTEILIEGQAGPRTATVTKQRDLVSGERFGFTLRAVDLGTDADGDPVSSCVVDQSDAPARNSARKIGGKNQTALLAALQERHRVLPEKQGLVSTIELREIAKAQGLQRARAKEAVDGLLGYGWLMNAVGGYRFIPDEPTP
jgi:hypothetical protein